MLEDLIKKCKEIFTEEEVNLIIKAYNYANIAHMGKKRQSGEPYIIHPIHVAYYVLTKHHLYDCNAVCAALLHDTIEDTNVTWEDLVREFNEDIANLVKNVTNSSDITYKDKNEKEMLNNAMILRNMLSDIRTIIIKSCDRLHNMETLEYKSPDSRLRKARQTFCFYVPLDYAIGANEPAKQLEDLCFKYMHPECYTHTNKLKQDFENTHCEHLEKMNTRLNDILASSGISYDLSTHMQSFYKLYKGLKKYRHLSRIPKFLTAQISVDTKEDCYCILELLKSHYHFEEVKDNMENTSLDSYPAIKVVTKGFKKYPLRIEIFTRRMKLFNSYGYATILNDLKGTNIRDVHRTIKNQSDFFSMLAELGKYYCDNAKLIAHAEEELLGSKIKIITDKGDIIKLPKGASVLDFAYFIHSEIGATAYAATVNGVIVDVNYILQDNDTVEVKCDERVVRTYEDINIVKTTRARRRILEKVAS